MKTVRGSRIENSVRSAAMGFFPRSFSLYLHVQYFTGYGESLVRYNERDSAFRAGFALTR